MIEPEQVETLVELVKRYSPSGKEQEAVNYLVGRMRQLNFDEAYSDEAGNAIGILGKGPRTLVLMGHIDTVRGNIPVRIVGDLLHGRGSVDAKGPLAAFVDGVAAFGGSLGWRIVVIGAVDEEGDSKGARHAVKNFTPEMAVIGEPSRWNRITIGYKGSAWAEVTFRQSMEHTASRNETTCETAIKGWAAIQSWANEFNKTRTQAFDRVIPSVHSMTSGEEEFETWAKLRIGVRLPVDLDPQAWYERVQRILPTAKFEPQGYPLPAYHSGKNNTLVRTFIATIRGMGSEPTYVLKSGTADMNIIGPAWNCPVLAYGPGNSSLDHTPNEHISLGEYVLAVDVIKGALQQLCQ